MKLKLDEAGHVVVKDGKPVYVHADGKEIEFDAPAAVAKIGQLNGEAKTHREAKEAAEQKLKAFEGIEDPEAAKKALNTVKNLDDKKLVDAGEVEKVKAEAIKAVRAEFEPVVKERDALKGQLDSHLVGGVFAGSKFIAEKFAAQGPAAVDIARSLFAGRFKVEDGKVVAYDEAGNKLYSRAKPGEIAGPEEALELIVDAYPHKAHILKGTGASGGGAGGGNGGGGGKTMTRAQFDATDPAAKSAFIKDGGTVTD